MAKIPFISAYFEGKKALRENVKLKEALTNKFYGGFDHMNGPGGLGSAEGVSSLFMETFMAGFTGKNYNSDPRAMLETYKAIMNAFPVLYAAISIREKALGKPILIDKSAKKDKGKNRDLEWLTDNMPIQNWKNPYKMQRGLRTLKDRLYSASLGKGTAFCQVKRSGTTPESVEIFRPEWFSACKNMYGFTEFIFNSDQGRIVILPDGDFQMYSQKVGDFDWGIPMAYGSEYFAWLALRKLENNNNFDARIAAGSMMFLLSGDVRNPQDGTIDDTILEKLQEAKDGIKAAIDIGMKHSNNTGRPWNLFRTLPIGAKLEAQPFGQGVQGPTNVPQIIELLMNQLIYPTGVPDFLLQSGTAAAMGSDKYREQRAQFDSLIEGDQSGIEPQLIKPATLFLIGNGASPKTIGNLGIEWDAPDTADLKIKADTELVKAQATGQHLLNLAGIMDGTGGGKSALLMQYLKDIGWDAAIAAELDFTLVEEEEEEDPQPKPAQAR